MKLKVGQAVIFRGRVAYIEKVGEKEIDPRTQMPFRWLRIRDDTGLHIAPSDHPELIYYTL